MKRWTFIISILFLWCSGATGLAQAQHPRPRITAVSPWMTYVSSDHRFTIQFLSLVREEQILFDKRLPYLKGTMVSTEEPKDRRFEVTYVDFLGALTDPAIYKKQRIGEIADAAVADGATLVDRRHVSAGTCEGEEATVRLPNPVNKVPSIAKWRMLTSGGIIYLLFFGGASDSPAEVTLADHFFNSFKMVGGCKDPAPMTGVTDPMVWFSGHTDSETGWHRVESPYGVRFLFPASGSLEWEDDPLPTGIIRHYTYSFRSEGYLFSVEIFDGYKAAARSSPAQLDAEFGKYFSLQRKMLEDGGYRVGDCQPVPQGTRSGRDCPITLKVGTLSGHARMFITPTQNFFITAFRYGSEIEEQPMLRFLNSIEFVGKFPRLDPGFVSSIF